MNGGNAALNMAALSNEATSSEQKSQSLIGKVSVSLQLSLEVSVAIETLSHALRTVHVHWQFKPEKEAF